MNEGSLTYGTARDAHGDRLVWLDLARGLAVVSMIIAHTWPWGGLWSVVEYLTAPWFALLIGLSLSLAWRKGRVQPALFLLDNVVRGVLLIALGMALQPAYAQIVVVLQTLGALTIVGALLMVVLRDRVVLWLVVGAVMVVASPLLMNAGLLWIRAHPDNSILVEAVDLLVAGRYYRTASFLAMAAAGAAVGARLARTGSSAPAPKIWTSAALVAASAAVYAGGKMSAAGAQPYSGTSAEVLGATLLSLSATALCWWLVDRLGASATRLWLGALVDTGRMALSAYCMQILALAAIVRLWLPGQRDDHWWVTVSVTAICLGTSWLWLRFFRQGPVEALLRLPALLWHPRQAFTPMAASDDGLVS